MSNLSQIYRHYWKYNLIAIGIMLSILIIVWFALGRNPELLVVLFGVAIGVSLIPFLFALPRIKKIKTMAKTSEMLGFRVDTNKTNKKYRILDFNRSFLVRFGLFIKLLKGKEVRLYHSYRKDIISGKSTTHPSTMIEIDNHTDISGVSLFQNKSPMAVAINALMKLKTGFRKFLFGRMSLESAEVSNKYMARILKIGEGKSVDGIVEKVKRVIDFPELEQFEISKNFIIHFTDEAIIFIFPQLYYEVEEWQKIINIVEKSVLRKIYNI